MVAELVAIVAILPAAISLVARLTRIVPESNAPEPEETSVPAIFAFTLA